MKSGKLYSDGGARGNPGPAGIGFVLLVGGNDQIEGQDFIDRATNNQAEYLALKKGLMKALEEGVAELACFLDSELVVKQMRGEYRVKDQALRVIFEDVQRLAESFESISFTHIRREKNKEADRLVNEAMDRALKSKKTRT